MYEKAKSCLQHRRLLSDYFQCNIGLRQGENLSPILFALFVNDLKEHLDVQCQGLKLLKQMCAETGDKILEKSCNIFLLMYADDMVMLADTPEQLQSMLDKLHNYCINVLDECGLSDIWQMQHEVNPEWIKMRAELTLRDQFLQKWSQSIKESSKCKLYHDIKTSFKFENYLNKLPFKHRKALTKFRTSNHNLPVEKGRHLGIDRNKRICQLCQSGSRGDEFHYLFICAKFEKQRKKYLNLTYSSKYVPDHVALNCLFNDEALFGNLSRFILTIMQEFDVK